MIRPHETVEAQRFVETLILVPDRDLIAVLVPLAELAEGAHEHRPEAEQWLKALGHWIVAELGHRSATFKRAEIELEEGGGATA